MGTYLDVVTLIQQTADPMAAWATSAYLAPYIKAAYREVQRRLATGGATIATNQQDVALPAAATTLSLTTTPALTADFVAPYRLWEKASTDSASAFIEMRGVEELPFRDQTTMLQQWMWLGGVIKFVGATQANTVRVEYESTLALPAGTPADNTDLVIPGIEDPMAWYAASHATMPRDPTFSSACKGRFDESFAEFQKRFTTANQFVPARRRAYGLARR